MFESVFVRERASDQFLCYQIKLFLYLLIYCIYGFIYLKLFWRKR